MLGAALAGCVLAAAAEASAQEPAKKTVVCSTTQVADFTRQVVGDDWQVECVLGAGQDPHLYEPTVNDANMVSRADLCLENGWNLEGHGWMRKMADNAGKPIVSCVEGIPPIHLPEGGANLYDPHAWFTPRNAQTYVQNIVRAVSELDPDNARRYERRAAFYVYQLRALDGWIRSQVNEIAPARRILVTHHDAFGYFCQEYGFRPVSPAGWTTEELSSISIERRQAVVDAIRETGVRTIFVETSLDHRMLTEIARDAGVEIGGTLFSDAMGGPGTAGETYLGMMRENVLTIVDGLR
jgi:manganese/iron transport system substrate-binding protein